MRDLGAPTKWIGLMSGTSADGVDAVLAEFRAVDGQGDAGLFLEARIEHVVAHGWGAERRTARLAAIERGGAADLARLHLEVAEDYARAVHQLLDEAGVAPSEIVAIGSHGQTVWHEPPVSSSGPLAAVAASAASSASAARGPRDASTSSGTRGVSLQLGDAATLAARTGIGVVHDFRSADLAAGGQGAPLVPWADRALFSDPSAARLLVNLGGMANLTWLPPRGSREPVVAFDTGPGNVWLDQAAARATSGALACDVDGRIAARGHPIPERLEALLADPFFGQRPPRSTGREYFSTGRLDRWLAAARSAGHDWPELLATLTALTAESIAAAVARWVSPRRIDEVIVAGGGARNPTLLRALGAALQRQGVHAEPEPSGPKLKCDVNAREALAFAALAWANRHGIPGNLPECTGASGPRVLGSWTPAPPTTSSPAPSRSRDPQP